MLGWCRSRKGERNINCLAFILKLLSVCAADVCRCDAFSYCCAQSRVERGEKKNRFAQFQSTDNYTGGEGKKKQINGKLKQASNCTKQSLRKLNCATTAGTNIRIKLLTNRRLYIFFSSWRHSVPILERAMFTISSSLTRSKSESSILISKFRRRFAGEFHTAKCSRSSADKAHALCKFILDSFSTIANDIMRANASAISRIKTRY